jgi:hypothetical protein
MKILMAVVITVLVIVLILVGVVAYMGFMPGVSDLFGFNKPKDLGVTYTAADLASFNAKRAPFVLESYPRTSDDDPVKFSGLQQIKAAFTSAELTAAANAKKAFYPLTDVQVKITQDIMEISGKIQTGRVGNYASWLGIPKDKIKAVTDIVTKFPANPPAYIKGKFEMINNRVTKFNVIDATIGKLNVTNQIVDNANGIRSAIEDAISYQKDKMQVQSLKIENGLLNFVGALSNRIRYPFSD